MSVANAPRVVRYAPNIRIAAPGDLARVEALDYLCEQHDVVVVASAGTSPSLRMI
jgi:hypothetical protein